jgi:hypothetical protein|eukprot:SAG25_NODE_645_length_6217_cov_5.064237_5_plen_81_part_00
MKFRRHTNPAGFHPEPAFVGPLYGTAGLLWGTWALWSLYTQKTTTNQPRRAQLGSAEATFEVVHQLWLRRPMSDWSEVGG